MTAIARKMYETAFRFDEKLPKYRRFDSKRTLYTQCVLRGKLKLSFVPFCTSVKLLPPHVSRL